MILHKVDPIKDKEKMMGILLAETIMVVIKIQSIMDHLIMIILAGLAYKKIKRMVTMDMLKTITTIILPN